MDFYGDDRKLSELGDSGFSDFLLEKDMFTPPVISMPNPEDYGLGSMDADWLDTFFEDPVLNDRMITDALQPPHIQSEHSYSLANDADADTPIKQEVITEDLDLMPADSTSPLNLTINRQRDMDTSQNEMVDVVSLVTMAPSIQTSIPTINQQTLLKPQTAIILTTQAAPLTTPMLTADRFVLPKVKQEPSDGSLSPDYSPYESISLPPTPPSSNTSDSEGGQSPRSTPSSPIRQSQILRQASLRPMSQAATSQLFSSPIPTSGVLLLTEEEKRTLVSEGYPIPAKLPLNKQEEKNLKKIRRKIKNKISAQESRRKKKEYLDTLEKRVEAFSQENGELRKKMDHLESNNRSLMSQLQKLQSIVNKVTSSPSSQTGSCLMVLVLCFAMFLGSWSPTTMIGYKQIGPVTMPTNNKVPMGPEPKDPTVDVYATPNMRSRVLMSLQDDPDELEYGPHTPSGFHHLFSHWFAGAKEDTSFPRDTVFSPEAPDAHIEKELLYTHPENQWSLNPEPPSLTYISHLTANITANVVSILRHNNTA